MFIVHITSHVNFGKITICCPEFHFHTVRFTFTTFLTFSFLTFHRATVKKGVTFRTATPSNSLLWDITLDMGADGAIAVICQRKAPIPGKRRVCSLHIMLYHCLLSMCIYLSHLYWFKFRQIELLQSKGDFFMYCWMSASQAIKSSTLVMYILQIISAFVSAPVE